MPRCPTALLTGLALCVLAAGPGSAGDAVPITVTRIPSFDDQHPEQSRFGALRYVGGLLVKSPDQRLGGLSGIDMSSDGARIAAVSDNGDLVTATIDYRDGVPVGLSDASVRRLPGEDGQPLGVKFGADAESLRARGGGGLPDDLLVGFERDHRVLLYPVDGAGRLGTPMRLSLPDGVKDLSENKGLEGIAVLPPGVPHAGAVVVFAERAADDTANVIPGWLIEHSGYRDLALRRSAGFDLTDLVALPNGDLLTLERRFNILTGVAMRIRRLVAPELDGPQPMSGETLFTGGMAYEIDNMEGVAVHRDAAGRIILTIVSDDNFSFLQRTLLLQFELL